MTPHGPCSRCGVDAPLYRRDDGSWGLACQCDPRRGAPAATPRARPSTYSRTLETVASTRYAFQPRARRVRDELTLWLPRVPVAAEGPNGRAWKRRSAAAQEWRELVAVALARLEPRPRFDACRIAYQVHRPTKHVSDRDNLVISLGKPVQDGLVAAQVLAGDGPDVVVATPDVEQLRSPLPFGFVVVRVRRAELREARPGARAERAS